MKPTLRGAVEFTLITGLGLVCAACAHRQAVVPTPAPQPQSSADSGAAARDFLSGNGEHHYVVRSGDCLWTIAGQNDVLGDSLDWPLLFRQNRDEIQDPDLIYPRQDLVYHPVLNHRLLAEIRREARDTPAYRPHTRPRRVLPLDYGRD